MPEIPAQIWIAACAHQLQQRWRTVDPMQLEEVAGGLWEDERLRVMTPTEAANVWLKPVVRDGGALRKPNP